MYWAELWTKPLCASISNTIATDSAFADDTILLDKSLKVLVLVLETQHDEGKPIGFHVFWAKTKYKCVEACWMKQCSLSMCVALAPFE